MHICFSLYRLSWLIVALQLKTNLYTEALSWLIPHFFGCGGGDNVLSVLSMYLDRMYSTIFSWIVIALVDFVLSQQGEIKFYLFQCV